MGKAILVINPGSTSTKFAVFEGGVCQFEHNLTHGVDQLSGYASVTAQCGMREKAIRDVLRAQGFDLKDVRIVLGRGGLLRPIPGGVYQVTAAMKEDLLSIRYGEHASNLGALIAESIATEIGVSAYIADPVVVDELSDLARVSGHRLFHRRSIFHALNQKAVCRRWCAENGQSYDEVNLIVAHMGGGVSVGLHSKGRVADVNNALDGEGPFSPERSGSLPVGDLVKLCFSGQYSEREILKMITGQGGLVSFMGSNDMRAVVESYRQGEADAGLYFQAFVYQVGKQIGSLAAAACGKIDAVILTGGVAAGQEVVDGIRAMCAFIAPVLAYPGEGELEALAAAGESVLSGELVPMTY